MISSAASSLMTLTAQSSVTQAGRATHIQVMTLSGGDRMHFASSLSATRRGQEVEAEPVKSAGALLQEQLQAVLDQLQSGVDAAGNALREAWTGAIDQGRIAADPEASLAQMVEWAGQDAAAPDTLRAMILGQDQAQKSMLNLRDQATDTLTAFNKKESRVQAAEFARALNQVIEDLATAQMAGKAMADDSLQGARAALVLIRDADPGASARDQGAMQATLDQARELAWQTERRGLVKQIRAMVERGDIQISMTEETYWGEVDPKVGVPWGEAAMVYADQRDILTSVSVSASLAAGSLSVSM